MSKSEKQKLNRFGIKVTDVPDSHADVDRATELFARIVAAAVVSQSASSASKDEEVNVTVISGAHCSEQNLELKDEENEE